MARRDHADHASLSLHDALLARVEAQVEDLAHLAHGPGMLAAQEHAALRDVLRVDREELLDGVELQPDQQIDRRARMAATLFRIRRAIGDDG